MPHTASLGMKRSPGPILSQTPTVVAIPAVRTAPDDLLSPTGVQLMAPPPGRATLRRAIVVDVPAPPDDAGSPAGVLAEHLCHRGAAVEVVAGLDVLPEAPDTLELPSLRHPHAPDLVVGVTGPDGDASAAARLACRSGARLLLVVTGLAHHAPEHVRSALRAADHVTVPSEAFRHPLHVYGVDAHRVSVIAPWAHSAPSWFDRTDARRRLGWPERTFIAVYAGSMTAGHDLEQVVHAASLVGPDILVALTGDGPRRPALADLAGTVSNAIVAGPLDDEHQALALVAADALIVDEPAVCPRLALSSDLARCLSAGRPVVATAPVSGPLAAELARADGAGLVVPPGEPTRLAGALLALNADPTRRVAMGLAAIAYTESQLSRETILAQFDTVVDAVLGS